MCRRDRRRADHAAPAIVPVNSRHKMREGRISRTWLVRPGSVEVDDQLVANGGRDIVELDPSAVARRSDDRRRRDRRRLPEHRTIRSPSCKSSASSSSAPVSDKLTTVHDAFAFRRQRAEAAGGKALLLPRTGPLEHGQQGQAEQDEVAKRPAGGNDQPGSAVGPPRRFATDDNAADRGDDEQRSPQNAGRSPLLPSSPCPWASRGTARRRA